MGKYDDILNMQRPKTDRIPMKLSDRAKIFMPFAALKGYEEALAKQEQLAIERMKEQRVHGE